MWLVVFDLLMHWKHGLGIMENVSGVIFVCTRAEGWVCSICPIPSIQPMLIYFAPGPTTEALETSHVMSTLKKQLENHVIVLFGRVFGAAEVATPALCHRLDIAPILRYPSFGNAWCGWIEDHVTVFPDLWSTHGLPIGFMYAIYGNIYHQYTPNVSIYTIHGSYGL